MNRNTWALGALSMLAACGGGGDTPTAQKSALDAGKANVAATTPRMLKGYYSFDGGPVEAVTFEDRNGQAVLDGDIVLGRTEDLLQKPAAERMRAQGIYVTNRGRWNGGVVVYTQPAAPGLLYDQATKAMHHIALHTRVRFSRYLGYTFANHPDQYTTTYDTVGFVAINDPKLGGSSAVGRQGGGPQAVSFNTTAEANNPVDGASVMVHELLHAIGAWHEQSRGDRNSYITVNLANVDPAYASQFSMHTSDGAMFGAYDYCSVMHYGQTAFSANGGSTMTPLQSVSCQVAEAWDETPVPFYSIGNRYGLSAGDAAMLEGLYSSAPAGRPLVNAGPNQVIHLTTDPSLPGNFGVTLDGSATQAVPGATIAKWSWKPSDWIPNSCPNPPCAPNPLAGYTGPTARAGYTLAPGERNVTLKYDLTVTDNLGRSLTDTVTVSAYR
jgi:Astacin (Peptidase family M12A)